MPQVFLSHKTSDKKIVLDIDKRLRCYLIDTWLDKSNIPGGGDLHGKIFSGIKKSSFFIAFVSKGYIESEWCQDELIDALRLKKEKKLEIIPVLLEPYDQIKAYLSKLENSVKEEITERASTIDSFLGKTKYIVFDEYKFEKSVQEIVDTIYEKEDFYFKSVTEIDLEGRDVQVIRMDTRKILEKDFLINWDLNLDEFLRIDQSNRNPFRPSADIGLFGRGPNWIYTFLSIPMFNKRNVFVYNSSTKNFVCVYAIPNDIHIYKKSFSYPQEELDSLI